MAALGVVAAAGRKETTRKVTELRAFENELGVQAPLGFWDPAGLSADAWLFGLTGCQCKLHIIPTFNYIIP